jgi:hypothetical protein
MLIFLYRVNLKSETRLRKCRKTLRWGSPETWPPLFVVSKRKILSTFRPKILRIRPTMVPFVCLVRGLVSLQPLLSNPVSRCAPKR